MDLIQIIRVISSHICVLSAGVTLTPFWTVTRDRGLGSWLGEFRQLSSNPGRRRWEMMQGIDRGERKGKGFER